MRWYTHTENITMSEHKAWPREVNRASVAPERSDLIRDDILDKILSHIEQNGFRGTSMRDIALICGVTKPTIYYYFKDKNEILEKLYQKYTDMFYETMEKLLDSEDVASQKMRFLIREQVMFSEKNRQFQKIFVRERHELSRGARLELARRERKYEAMVQSVIEDGQKSGEFRSLDATVTMLAVLGLLSSVHRWVVHVPQGIDKAADAIVELVMSGISADAPGEAKAGRAKARPRSEPIAG